MNCVVCGKKFSFLARTFGTDAEDGVCRDCEEEGPARMRRVVERIGKGLELTQAKDEFDGLALRYKVPAEKLTPLRMEFSEGMARHLAGKEDLSEGDVEYLNLVNEQFHGVLRVAPESAIARYHMHINGRQAMDGWKRGEPPKLDQCRGLLLEEGEVCHWEEPARLLEQRTRAVYVGGSQGISVRLARGLTYRVGAFKGERIDSAYLADCGAGTLHITDRRVAFTGAMAAASVAFKKFISVAAFEDGFQIFRSGAKRPTIVQVTQPELTLQILGYATPAPND